MHAYTHVYIDTHTVYPHFNKGLIEIKSAILVELGHQRMGSHSEPGTQTHPVVQLDYYLKSISYNWLSRTSAHTLCLYIAFVFVAL